MVLNEFVKALQLVRILKQPHVRRSPTELRLVIAQTVSFLTRIGAHTRTLLVMILPNTLTSTSDDIHPGRVEMASPTHGDVSGG